MAKECVDCGKTISAGEAVPPGDAVKERLLRIFTPTDEELEIEAEIDRLVDVIASEAARYFPDKPETAIDEVGKALIEDRDRAYEQLNILLKDDAALARPATADASGGRGEMVEAARRWLAANFDGCSVNERWYELMADFALSRAAAHREALAREAFERVKEILPSISLGDFEEDDYPKAMDVVLREIKGENDGNA